LRLVTDRKQEKSHAILLNASAFFEFRLVHQDQEEERNASAFFDVKRVFGNRPPISPVPGLCRV